MKLWLRANPDITAQTLRDDPINGYVPAICTDASDAANVQEIYAVILPAEWTTEEIVPAPEPVPEEGFLVLYGDDPAYVSYEFHVKEKDAAVAMTRRGNGFGYVKVFIERNAMFQA